MKNIKVDNSSFFKAITTVLIADFTMSLDNVLGVAGAAKDHYFLLYLDYFINSNNGCWSHFNFWLD